MSSSQDRDFSQNTRVNPYEVTALTESQDLSSSPTLAARSYALQMDWADRRRFLKAVGPLRAAAMLAAVGLLVGLYGLLSPIHLAWEFGSLMDLPVATLGRTATSLVQTIVMAYGWWLQWQLADAIAKAAGGTDGHMRRWSQIQVRAAYTALATVSFAVFFFAWA